MIKKQYDTIIVGAGHAGVESAFSMARRGLKVALVTLDKSKIASMPCNPSIGGPAKGIITREIDALGGVQAKMADRATIQIKMLNTSKGPGVRALRAQIDKDLYSQIIYEAIIKEPNITLLENEVINVMVQNNKVSGVELDGNKILLAKAIIITTGTYLKAKVLRGANQQNQGPDGQKAANQLSTSLQKLGFKLQRLKTGTPPRVLTASIDFSKVEEEILPLKPLSFSSQSEFKLKKQVSCWLTHTNDEIHELIKKNVNRSSMYSGLINGVGPRYCPSIEDKIVRFSHKPRHQVFYEPETASNETMYINGLSTSMPIDVQEKMVKLLPGMQNAKITKWGYAIEYDAIDALELKSSLASKKYENLFFAGQINGTSGYEEAAAQGLIAGINAGQFLLGLRPLILQRNESYIGVLVDDLVTKGTSEPYRMLTSRSEFRLLLRNDNADLRLTKYGYELNLISKKQYDFVLKKEKAIAIELNRLANTYVSKNSTLAKKYQISDGISYLKLLKRPEVNPSDISNSIYLEDVVIFVRLEGYILKQQKAAQKLLKLESFIIPNDIDYFKVANLAIEAREKLQKVRPLTIGQASRVSGINPADIQMLMYYIQVSKYEN